MEAIVYPIYLRNAATGEEKSFADKQAVANFLDTQQDVDAWTGWQSLGELPVAEDLSNVSPLEVPFSRKHVVDPDAQAKAEAAAAADAEAQRLEAEAAEARRRADEADAAAAAAAAGA